MKMMKKLATLLLAICLAIPCFSMVSFAANGAIQFSDPSTAVGETLEVTGKVKRTDNTGFGKVEITMTYDTSYLKFKSGNGIVEAQAGEITYTGDATNDTGSTHEFKITFDVLKAGTTKLTIKDATVKSLSGTVLDYTKGSSTITIAEGEGTTVVEPTTETVEPTTDDVDGSIEINGAYYTISNEIPESEIPEGYEASTLEYDLVEYNVVYNDSFGLSLAYLVGEDGVGYFFMYVEEDATFAPYAEIAISDTTKIALLSDLSDVIMPNGYALKEDLIKYENFVFPGWTDQENEEYSIIYAINNKGEKSLYQLDEEEMTYQRFTAPEVVIEKENNTFIGKLSDLLQNHMDYVILGTGLGFILFVIIIVILSVKLYNRNAELDEIYDEYGLDEDDDQDKDDEDDYDDDEDDGDIEMEMLVQEGMKEVFPEDDEEEIANPTIEEPVKEMVVEPVAKVNTNTVEIPIERVAEAIVEEEDSLGAALAKQKEAEQEENDEFYDDEDDILENFSMDFIDLDD